jgi:hypothetical protein
MSFITAQQGEDTMYKRTFKALLAASAVALIVPVAAAAMPTDHSAGAVVVQRSAPVVSEKVAGLNLQNTQARLGLSKSPIVSEKTAGLNLQTQSQPTERVVASSTTSFDWGDAGIGAGVMFGSILAAVAAAGVVRRHHGHFAH